MADDLESVLKAAPLSQAQRADLWDAYQGATSPDDLAAKLQTFKIPQTVKAGLWDLKARTTVAPPPAPATPPNLRAVGGDTINGVDPNAAPSVVSRVASGLRPLAQPQSGLDLLNLGSLSSAPVAESVLPKVVAPVMDAAGRGMSALGNAFKSTGKYLGVGDVLYHRGGVIEGAAVAAAPYALDIAGQAAQKGAAILRRDAPLFKFEVPAVTVERPTAAVTQAAQEAAPTAAQATPAVTQAAPTFTSEAVKARLNAAETTEYLRMLKTGKSPTDALAAIQQQREFAQRFGLPNAETVRATRGTNKERILRETP